MTPTAPPPGLPPLPMSQTETGALATAPLSAVVNAATDALYQDLFDLVHGEIKIELVTAASNTSAAAAVGGINEGEGGKASSAGGGLESHAAMTVEGKLTAAALGVTFGDTTTATAPAATSTSTANPNDVILETSDSSTYQIIIACLRINRGIFAQMSFVCDATKGIANQSLSSCNNTHF